MSSAVALPLTYPDVVCIDDVDPYANETASDLQSLIQDVYHLLKEFPGSNPDDPDRGIGVEQYLGGTSDQFKGMCSLIEAQLTVDDRITSASAKVTTQSDGTFLVRVDIGTAEGIIPLEYGYQNGQFTTLTQGR